MSHRAMSIALIAEQRILPPGKNPPRNIFCHRCSVRMGSSPTSMRGQVLDHGGDGHGLGLDAGLADAIEARVGLDRAEDAAGEGIGG